MLKSDKACSRAVGRRRISAALGQTIPDLRAETCLGLKDRRVELPESLPGPFGKPEHALNVPGWMVQEDPDDAVLTDATDRNGEIHFCPGSKTFLYDRLGLSAQ